MKIKKKILENRSINVKKMKKESRIKKKLIFVCLFIIGNKGLKSFYLLEGFKTIFISCWLDFMGNICA